MLDHSSSFLTLVSTLPFHLSTLTSWLLSFVILCDIVSDIIDEIAKKKHLIKWWYVILTSEIKFWLNFVITYFYGNCGTSKIRRFLTCLIIICRKNHWTLSLHPDQLEGNNQVRCFIYLILFFLAISFYFSLHYYQTSVSVTLDVNGKVINNWKCSRIQ